MLRSSRGVLRSASSSSMLFAPTRLQRSLPRNLRLSDPLCAKELSHVRPVTYSKLDNGFRVACEHVPDIKFCTIGVWIDAGSRFETQENSGVAHFLEHLNFKGTKHFTKKQIEDTFEHLGAHFNAYTSRDRTAYYIKVFNKDVDRVLGLLSDILKNGTYDPRDVELERPTILAEMREVEMLVDEVVMDNVHQCAFDAAADGLPLTILGPVENIAKTITRTTVKHFIDTHYTGPRMMLIASGGLTHDQLHRYAETYFGDLPSHSNRTPCAARYVGGQHCMWNREMMTTHTAAAFPICGAQHADCVPLQLVHNIIGQYHRERHDQFSFQRMNPKLLDAISVGGSMSGGVDGDALEMWKPFYTPYEDISLLGYHFVTVQDRGSNNGSSAPSSSTQSKVLEYFLRTFQELADKGPSEQLLEEAKSDYKAAQMIMTDSTTNSAEDLGRQMIHFGRRVPLQEVFEQVDAVTPASFRDVLAKYVSANQPTVATIGPPSAMPAYDEMLLQRVAARASSSSSPAKAATAGMAQ